MKLPTLNFLTKYFSVNCTLFLRIPSFPIKLLIAADNVYLHNQELVNNFTIVRQFRFLPFIKIVRFCRAPFMFFVVHKVAIKGVRLKSPQKQKNARRCFSGTCAWHRCSCCPALLPARAVVSLVIIVQSFHCNRRLGNIDRFCV